MIESILDEGQEGHCLVVASSLAEQVESVLDLFRAVAVVVEGCVESVKFSLESLLLTDDIGPVW
jgi:hypothetical protein